MIVSPLPPGLNGQRSLSIGLGECVVGRKRVGQGDWVIYGLGSCIGLILSDAKARAAGMAHILLPESPTPHSLQPAKYVDTAIPFLLDGLDREGASKRRLVAQIAGGARMLQVAALGDIGHRNLLSVRKVLSDFEIPIVAESVGGTVGRTLRWNQDSGTAIVSQVGKKETVLTPALFRFR